MHLPKPIANLIDRHSVAVRLRRRRAALRGAPRLGHDIHRHALTGDLTPGRWR